MQYWTLYSDTFYASASIHFRVSRSSVQCVAVLGCILVRSLCLTPVRLLETRGPLSVTFPILLQPFSQRGRCYDTALCNATPTLLAAHARICPKTRRFFPTQRLQPRHRVVRLLTEDIICNIIIITCRPHTFQTTDIPTH